MTDKARFLKKKIGSPNFFAIGLNHVQNKVFHHLIEKVIFEPLMNFKRKNIMDKLEILLKQLLFKSFLHRVIKTHNYFFCDSYF